MAAPPKPPPPPDPRLVELGLDRVELLAGLDKKAVDVLVAGRSSLWIDRGRALIVQGEHSGCLYVVLEGLLVAWRTEPGGAIARFDTVRPGEWFGEASALSNQPAMATYEAQTECTLVRIDAAAFKELRRASKSFGARIDARYRERSLAAHLRIVPSFKLLDESSLKRLREHVELLTVSADEVVAKEGEPADAVYLVRSGAVKCTTKDATGRERILGYAPDNSSFGERALSGVDARWPGTYVAMARTDLVKVPRELVDELLDAGERSKLATAARAIASQESSASVPGLYDLVARTSGAVTPTQDELEVMVAGQSVKGGHALVIDLQKCVRCNACVESCASVHGDRVPRLSKTGNRISSQKTLASACYHCEIPSCMLSCSFGAIRRDARGSIDFVQDNCVGCTSCVAACPYDVIRMTGFEHLDAAHEPSLLARVAWPRWVADLFKPASGAGARSPVPGEGAVRVQKNAIAGREVKVPGKAIKCDLCAGMPFEACVYNCPCGAILRVEPETLFKEGR